MWVFLFVLLGISLTVCFTWFMNYGLFFFKLGHFQSLFLNIFQASLCSWFLLDVCWALGIKYSSKTVSFSCYCSYFQSIFRAHLQVRYFLLLKCNVSVIVSLHFSYWLTRSLLSVFHISLSVLKCPSVVSFSSALWTVPFHFTQHFTKCLQIFSKLYINPSSGTLSVNYLFFSLWIIWVWATIKSLKWDICSSSVVGLIFCFNNWSFYLNIFSPFCKFSVLHGLCCLSLISDFMLFTLGLSLALSPRTQLINTVRGHAGGAVRRWAAHVWSIKLYIWDLKQGS